MSKPRRVRVVRWFEDGVLRVQRFIDKEPTVVSSAPARRLWLVDVHDPLGHLVAVLAANGGHEPLLYDANVHSVPALVLLREGLAAAHVRTGQDGRAIVTPVGTPRSDFPVYCGTCRKDYSLPAEPLRNARGAKPGRPGRLTVGVSRTTDGAAQR